MKKISQSKTIEMVVVTRENLAPQEFLVMHRKNPTAIKTSTFIAPKIGGKGFGSFEVEYRTPKLVAA